MGTSDMIKGAKNNSTLKILEIQLENYSNCGKMCENVSRSLGCEDSVDDFINKHSLFLDKDVKHTKSNSNPNHHFDSDLLVSTIIKNNIKLNKILYTLVQEIEREKQNKKSKRFIKLLKKEYDKDSERNMPYQIDCKSVYSKPSQSSSNSQITRKLLNVLNNLYKESEKSNLQLQHKGTSEPLRIHSSKINKRYYLRPGQISSCDDISMLQYDRCFAKPNLSPSDIKRAKKLSQERSLSPSIYNTFSKENRKLSGSKTDYFCQEKRRKQTIVEDKYDKAINIIDQPNYLGNIEFKIENLIESINTFIAEIREQKIKEKRAISKTFDINSINNATTDLNVMKQLKIDTMNVANLLSNKNCDITTQTDTNVELCKTLKDKNIYSNKDEEIQIQENCYFVSASRKTLKERATEITKSFLETQLNGSKTINPESNSSNLRECMVEKITKEANTEPLGVLALLRMSTQSVKQFLSCLPTIDSYIPHLQFFCLKGREEPNYICNICGAAFSKATMLNEHIKGHDLGSTRDCAVCQHVLKTHKLYIHGLFKCQFCGQRFTRAYCCELHQQSCAKRLGLRHDVSNLILLQ